MARTFTQMAVWPSGAALVLVLGLTVMEIVTRRLGSPTSWSLDLSRYLLCFIVAGAMPAVVMGRGHVVIDLMSSRLQPRMFRPVARVLDLTCALACLFAAILCFNVMASQYASGIQTLGGVVFRKWILTAMLLYGFGASGLIYLGFVVKGRDREQGEEAVSAL